MQWRRKRRLLYVIGSAHHALLVKQYREDGCNGACSNNEEEMDGDRDSVSPLNTSYARASAQQRMPRTKPTTTSSRGGSYNYRHRSYYQQPHDINQPLVTTEKKTFNEEEYTKITTPRQDVLFKKGYLGRKRPTAAPPAETTASNSNPDVANGNLSTDGTVDQNGEVMENDQTSSEMMSPVEEQPQYVYATNGYVDQTGAPPPGLYYINGSGYELYDPYSGNVTVVVGPAPHYGGPGGGPPVLAAVPCQPLPLQPLEWFNPAFLPYVTAPCHNGLATARERRKRYSTDSQNCSPQSSESTEPPGSPQECDMGEPPGPTLYSQPPAYVYPGYMFGPPMYNVNGVTVQGAPTQPPSCDTTGSNKRRKKKRRRRKRKGGAEDGCSEESSSDEKELEEPISVTSQESSSQEIESDSKQSTNTTTVNNDSSSSPLSSCQTVTPTDNDDVSVNSSTVEKHSTAFDSHTLQKGNSSAPSTEKDSCCKHNCNFKPVVKEQENLHFISEQTLDATKDKNKDLNSIQLLNDHKHTEELVLRPDQSTCTLSSREDDEVIDPSHNHEDAQCNISKKLETDSTKNSSQEILNKNSKEVSLGINQAPLEIISQCNGDLSPEANEVSIKIEESSKLGKQKKSGKQSSLKHKKTSKGKEDKQKRSAKVTSTVSNLDTVKRKSNKKRDENIINSCTPQIAIIGTYEEAENFNVLSNVNESEISNFEDKSSLIEDMDGNEEKPSGTEDPPVCTQEQLETISSQSGNETEKYDSFAEFEKSSKVPSKPIRKEKQKSPPSNSKLSQKELVQTREDATSMELCPISLRPDIPKLKPKGPSFTQQFKGTTDILESITEALIKEPALQLTIPRDTCIKREINTSIKENQPKVLRVEAEVVASHERISELQDCFLSDVVTSSCEEVPNSPLRRKKLNDSSKQSCEISEAVGGDALEESSGGSTTSSTTQESEESVIELLSSTHTNPEERLNQDLSSDEEENVIFTQNKTEDKSKILDIKSVPPDKSEVYTPSISGPSIKDSSQIFMESKCSAPMNLDLLQTSPDVKYHSSDAIKHIELYAEGLSKHIVSKAVHESSKKRLTLPITEAVTRWLRSQSPEILSLPPPVDETESDASSEEQEQTEKSADSNENQQSTGQKNVFCNPLPVPLLENCHHLSINIDVNHSGYSDGIGRRVALNQNTTAYKNDNNKMTVFASILKGDRRLESGGKDKIYFIKNEDKSELSPVKHREHGQNIEKDSTSNADIVFNEFDCNIVKRSIIKDKKLEGNTTNSSQAQTGEDFSKELNKKHINEEYSRNCEKVDERTNFNLVDDDDDLSFTSDETLECEWDLWDCSPTKPPQSSVIKLSNNLTPVDEMLAKIPEDYCSQMCDPAVSVAKYYSLGALQPAKKNCIKTDGDSSNYSEIGGGGEEEVVDALKHFQHELEDDDGLQTHTARDVEAEENKSNYGNPEIYRSHYGEADQRIHFDDTSSRNVYGISLSQRTQAAHMLHRKSSILVSRLKGEGPFPCGGICCILQ